MKLSIITVNYNNADGLKRTLDSVASQTCHEFEHIIIDGGSTDGSVDIIRDYESSNSLTLSWVSEKDNGIYDAMNKGIKKASGEYLYFLNGGDALDSSLTVQTMMNAIDGSDFVIGRVNKTYNGQIIGQSELLSERDMSLYYMYLRGINHQSALIKRELLVQNPYDISVKYGADWNFFVQEIVLGGASVKFIDAIFAKFDVSGVSSNTPAVRQEKHDLLTTIIPERIARDYLAIAPHYYEVVRIEWLLRHPFWYKIYRAWATLGRKICKS